MRVKVIDPNTLQGSSTSNAPTGTTPVTFRTDDSKRDRLDAIAEAKGRNRNSVINEAIDNYLELQEWQAEHVRRGRALADAGETFSSDEVRAMMAEHYERRKSEK